MSATKQLFLWTIFQVHLSGHSPGPVPTAGAPGTVPGHKGRRNACIFFGPKRKFGQNPTLNRGLIGDRSRFFTPQARTLGAQATEAF